MPILCYVGRNPKTPLIQLNSSLKHKNQIYFTDDVNSQVTVHDTKKSASK